MTNFKAEVIGVYPNKVKIAVDDLDHFQSQDGQLEKLKIGSYLEVSDNDSHKLIVIIDSYSIEFKDTIKEENGIESILKNKRYIIEASPIGILTNDGFKRGNNSLTIPPTLAKPASKADIKIIYESSIKDSEKFIFSKLVQDPDIAVPVNGNKFFNKHFAIIGSTGSGKSHTVAAVLQQAIKEKKGGGFDGLNNSHIIIFDIHGEYKEAFPDANHINSENVKIPYWLFDSDELGDLFIESNEENSHNEVSQFRYAVTENKKKENPTVNQEQIYFDSPLKFKIDEVIRYIKNVNNEMLGKSKGENCPKRNDGQLVRKRVDYYFSEDIEFCEESRAAATKTGNGPFKGDFERFILRLENTRHNPRLRFLFNHADTLELEDVLKQFLGYSTIKSNVTVIDLSGIPFEVLSITVSLISRILFVYGYYYKKLLTGNVDCETPLLLVYEEAHKYVPRSDLAKYKASRNAIERIAKEGRKYGVTLGIISQRPSEISETIFSQCNNFIAMRLTNPDDQNYVKKILPDTLGDLINYLPSLQAGEALLIGESVILPSLVKINFPDKKPKSTDICYLDIWKEKWKEDIEFKKITDEWKK